MPELSPREILQRVWNLGNQLKNYTDKFVFSFIDVNNYKKVQRNLVKETSLFSEETIEKSEFSVAQMDEIAEGLMKIRDRWELEGRKISMATCAEEIDFKKYGIDHNRCIDGELMKQLFPEDAELIHYLNYGKLPDKNALFAEEFGQIPLPMGKLKDKGQRKICGCMISKDIGIYNTCSHFCTYCYANTSKATVIKNRKLHNENSESIIP